MAGPLSDEIETTSKEQAALIKLLLEQDEVHWMQRSRVNWLQHGDRNTSFFHQFASAQRKKNFIKKLKHDDEWVEGTSALKPIIFEYFSFLFTSEVNEVDQDVMGKIQQKATPKMNEKLLAPFFWMRR
jgi:hypothetical protein